MYGTPDSNYIQILSPEKVCNICCVSSHRLKLDTPDNCIQAELMAEAGPRVS